MRHNINNCTLRCEKRAGNYSVLEEDGGRTMVLVVGDLYCKTFIFFFILFFPGKLLSPLQLEYW